jgi:hypothetical protein
VEDFKVIIMKSIKIVFAALAFFLLCNTAFAQDIIYKKDGTKEKVSIEEINPTEVVYKKFDRPEGPTYRVLKSSLLLIEFADGTIEVYNKGTEQTGESEEPEETENNLYASKLGQNIISINYLHILNGNVHLGYERLSKSGVAGIKLSVNFNVDDVQSEILRYQRDFTTGLDVNLYPTGQGKVKYFLGPSFRVGTVSSRYYDYWNGGVFMQDEVRKYSYFGIFFNNGFNIQPTPKLFLGFQAALGIGRFSGGGVESFAEVDGIFAFNMGYRF